MFKGGWVYFLFFLRHVLVMCPIPLSTSAFKINSDSDTTTRVQLYRHPQA